MNVKTKHNPILAVTMGDPAGIGPEIAVKTFALKRLQKSCRLILVGHQESVQNAIDLTGLKLKINVIDQVGNALFEPGIIDLYEIESEHKHQIEMGAVSSTAGNIAFIAVKTAIDLAQKNLVDGTVTGPINKEAINLAGHKFSGHTEIYAHYTNTEKYAMLLADENFRVIHVTTHVSLREACDLVKKDRVLEVIHLIHDGLQQLGINKPRIGVAGLNPHSGDGGLFGNEDNNEIVPAVTQAQNEGVNAEGPVPADTLFALAIGGKYDGCVAMYHDQGHIPFKLLGFSWDKKNGKMKSVKGVNITLGLPIIRTSVDHGTAFEIAGKGIASPDALIQAVDYAIKLVN